MPFEPGTDGGRNALAIGLREILDTALGCIDGLTGGNPMDKAHDISLTLVRKIKATPEKVFAAWTNPEILKKWMSPRDEMKTVSAETNLVVGGKYRIIMREPDGEDHIVGGVYREISKNKKLAFTWSWESTPEVETLVTIELRKISEGTEITLTHANFGTEQARDMHNHGWLGCIGRLEKYINA